MKKTNNKMQLLLLSVVLLGTTACTGDFADINRNPNEVTDEQLQANNYKIGTKPQDPSGPGRSDGRAPVSIRREHRRMPLRWLQR